MTGNVRDLFEETMTDNEPPLSTNVGDIVAAGRRRRTHRRLGWIGATATAGVAVVLSVSLILPGLSGGDEAVPGGDTTPSAEETTESDEAYPVVDTWEEYSDIVRELFVEQAPDFIYNAEEGGEPLELTESGQVHSNDPDFYYENPHVGSAFLKTAEGQPVGSVSVSAYEPGPWDPEPGNEPFAFADPVGGPIVSCWSGETEVQQGGGPDAPVEIQTTETECDEVTTPGGDRMIRISMVEYYEDREPHTYENTVVIYRADETAVVVTGFCGNEDEDDEYGGTCHEIQFDLDQLEAIALQLPKVIVTNDGQ